MTKDEAMGREKCQCSRGQKFRLTRMEAWGEIVKDFICSAKEFRLSKITGKPLKDFQP